MLTYRVYSLTPPDMDVNTSVWISEQAMQRLEPFLDEADERDEFGQPQFLQKLMDHAVHGFWLAEAQTREIKDEWDNVKRFGRRYSQFRVIGFYEPGVPKKRSFVIMDAFTKAKGGYTKRERQRVNEVARIRQQIERGEAALRKGDS